MCPTFFGRSINLISTGGTLYPALLDWTDWSLSTKLGLKHSRKLCVIDTLLFFFNSLAVAYPNFHIGIHISDVLTYIYLIIIYLWNVELKFWCPFWILCFDSSCPATIFRQNLFIILNLQKNIHRVTVICAALAVASQSILDLLKPVDDRLSKEN